MFLFRLEKSFHPLVDATSLLSHIANDADLKFSTTKFSIIASHPSLPVIATLQVSHRFFAEYSVDHKHSWRISLQTLHAAIFEGTCFSSMTIQVQETLSRMILRFQLSRQRLRHVLTLLPSREEDFGKTIHEKFFTINSHDFREIVRGVPPFPNYSICITVTDSQVKFFIGALAIIFRKEDGRCTIVGYEGEVETQYRITLHPMLFFLKLSYRANRLWFYKTTDSRSAIFVPAFGLYAQYVIYFPLR